MDNIGYRCSPFFPLLSCDATPVVQALLHLKGRILIPLSGIDLLEHERLKRSRSCREKNYCN